MRHTIIKKGFMLFSAIFFASLAHAASPEVTMPKTFTICTDTNFQFPFSFMKNQHPVGLHIDIIDAALKSLGIEPIYEPTTWSSCLNRAKAGSVDSVATAAYMDERALYLYYPVDANNDNKSSWRITQVAYKVISKRLDPNGQPNTYEFDGNIANLPEPIHVPAGYFIVHDLQKARLKVKEGQTSLENFQDLLHDKSGSLIDLAEVAQHLSLEPAFANQFYIHKQPLVVKSYYLAFSKGGHLNLMQAQQVWDAITKVRDDKALMAEFLKKY
ncbi:MAG: transporter substrate-binding domain-containing protein [Gammaproteobacteria bacterium]|nr:transporter substrate-binding domain-containing protein [Gammaproteobacteria bacterium]MBP9728928.1 transporter substrate-binding domain-containing protein [Gammaproteobacteria bacterium]